MNTLAGRVRLARERAKITQHQLAEKIGTSQQSIAKIERGETLQPRKIKQIALALGVSVNGCSLETSKKMQLILAM